MSRENRLLLIVVLASGLSLLLLSRYRFPGETRTINPLPAPLERLAARATFDDLASIIVQLQTRIAPMLCVLRVHSTGAGDVPSVSKLLEPPQRPAGESRLVLGWRVRPDLLLAHLGPGDRVDEIVGIDGSPTMLGVDPIRLVGLIRAPAGGEFALWQEAAPPATPQYVLVAEATQGGPALRPIFLGRTDPIDDPRWRRPLLALPGTSAAQPGSMIFSLEGGIIGMIVLQENLPIIAPTGALLSTADDLQQRRANRVGDIGIQVVDMTDALAAAVGAPHGAIVAYVRPGGPADGALQIGDVITAVGDTFIPDAEALRIDVARRTPGSSVELSSIRRGAPFQIRIAVGTPPAAQPARAPMGLGLSLRSTPDAGSEVLRVADDGAAHEGGVMAGDRIASLDGSPNPTALAIQRAFNAAPSGAYLVLGVTRGDAHLVLAIRKP